MIWIFFFAIVVRLSNSLEGYYQPPRGSLVWGYFTPPLLYRPPTRTHQSSMDAMVDLTNNLGVAILKDHSYSRGNFAFSPYGVASVLVVLYEGACGESASQIHRAVGFPFDKDVIRVGFRSIHRHLRSYFSHEGYLSGISLNKEGSALKPEFKRILKFYGYDVDVNHPLDEDIGLEDLASPSTPSGGVIANSNVTSTPPFNEDDEKQSMINLNSTEGIDKNEEKPNVPDSETGNSNNKNEKPKTSTEKPSESSEKEEPSKTTDENDSSEQSKESSEKATEDVSDSGEEEKQKPDYSGEDKTENKEEKPTTTKEDNSSEENKESPEKTSEDVNESNEEEKQKPESSEEHKNDNEEGEEEPTKTTKDDDSSEKDKERPGNVNDSSEEEKQKPDLSGQDKTDKEEEEEEEKEKQTEATKEDEPSEKDEETSEKTSEDEKDKPTHEVTTENPESTTENQSDNPEKQNEKPNENKTEESTATELEEMSITTPSDVNKTEIPKDEGEELQATTIKDSNDDSENSEKPLPTLETETETSNENFESPPTSTLEPQESTKAPESTDIEKTTTTNSNLDNGMLIPQASDLETNSESPTTKEDLETTTPVTTTETREESTSQMERRRRDVSTENNRLGPANTISVWGQMKLAGVERSRQVRQPKMSDLISLWNEDRRRKARTITDYLKWPPASDVSLQLQNGMFDSHVSRNLELYKSLPRLLFLVDGAIDTPVPMMTYTHVFPFAYIPRLHTKALEFPLDDVRYKLLILLPVERRGLRQLIYDLTEFPLREVLTSLQPTRVRAMIPPFMVEGFVILTSSLQKLGIWDVFDPRKSNLSGMSIDPELYVRNIEQSVTVVIRNYVEILDIQTRTMAARNIEHDFEATHPFLYFVLDTATNVALMAGQILDPLNSRIY